MAYHFQSHPASEYIQIESPRMAKCSALSSHFMRIKIFPKNDMNLVARLNSKPIFGVPLKEMKVKVIRSRRRKRTVSAMPEGGVLVVRAPAHVSQKDLEPIIEDLHDKWVKALKEPKLDNGALERRAQHLNRLYFNDRLNWASIRWVTNQKYRYGSCSPEDRTIRISHHVAKMPKFVQDYIIMHELAHLVHADHSRRFWKIVNRFPLTERARGYLMAKELEEME